MENKELNRYVGDYDHFQEVYAVKKAQKEAAYNRQQQEISELKDFVARNKARVATRNMAMSRQKKLDKMDVIELAKEKPKPEFHFRTARTSGRFVVTAKELVIGYEEPLSRPLTFAIERGEKIVLTGANGIGKTTLLKSILGLIPSLGGNVELGDYLEIGYFEQEMPKGNTNSCIQEIWEEFPSYTSMKSAQRSPNAVLPHSTLKAWCVSFPAASRQKCASANSSTAKLTSLSSTSRRTILTWTRKRS